MLYWAFYLATFLLRIVRKYLKEHYLASRLYPQQVTRVDCISPLLQFHREHKGTTPKSPPELSSNVYKERYLVTIN